MTNSEAEDPEKTEQRWKFLEHTADIRMEVYGGTMEELFSNAASGLMSLLGSGAHIVGAAELEIEIEGGEPEELLVNWLRELLYQHETKGFLLSEAHMLELGEKRLKARLTGGTRSSDDEKDMEIKGVTYHGISVEKTNSGYSARVVFDI